MPWALGCIITAVLLLSWLLHYEYRSWKRLAHIPGPTMAHFSILWFVKQVWCGNLFPCLEDVGRDFGPLVRVGPNALVCSDPYELRRISGIRSRYTKGPAYEASRVTDGEHVVSQRDPAKHKALRAKMGPAYSIDMQPSVDRHILGLIDLIERKYATDPMPTGSSAAGQQCPTTAIPMDFAEKIQFYALDCLGEMAFGDPFGFIEHDEDVGRMLKINDLSLRLASVAGLVSWLPKMRSKWPFKYMLPREGDKVGFGILFGFAKDVVERRTAPGAIPKNDMLQAFIKSGQTQEELQQQVLIHILSGSDTTANWARSVMLTILTCPPAYMALQKEIDIATASNLLSLPIAADAEARALPYLDAVMREALRTNPSAVPPSKLSPVDPDYVSGFLVPGGTQIGANVPSLLKSEAIFGEDAGCFRPERWLEAAQEPDGERLNRMKASFDLAFGAGKYSCPGKAIAWMEVRKLFVELLRRYDFSIINSKRPLHVESYVITVVQDFNIRVTRRTKRDRM